MHRAGQTSTWQHINKAISLGTNVILLYVKCYFYAGFESIPLSKSGQFVVIIFRIGGIWGERSYLFLQQPLVHSECATAMAPADLSAQHLAALSIAVEN